MKRTAMALREIVEKCNILNIYDKREITDDYCEIVFYSKDVEEWTKILADFLAPAVKPQGVEPTKDDSRLTENYGGIRSHQTLFKKEYGDVVIIAMFWPWGDGSHTTLKMVFLQSRKAQKKL